MKKKLKNKKRTKQEFSKLMLITLLVVSFFFTLLSYILAWFDKNTVENLSIELLRILWGVDGIGILSYSAQNIGRAWSLNKYSNSTTQQTETLPIEEYNPQNIRGM